MNTESVAVEQEGCRLYPQCLNLTRWWFGLSERDVKDLSKRTVLVADDELVIRDMMKRVITERIGCPTDIVASGDEAILALENKNYDVLLTDMVMPGLHGLELIKTVRERWPGTDIIVLTGFVEKFPYVEVIRAGATDFVSKPHQPQEIEAKLLRLLREREMREQLLMTESKYRSLFERSMESYALLNPETYEIVDVNSAFCDLCTEKRLALLGKNLFSMIGESDIERVKAAFTIFSQGGQGTLGDVTMARSCGEELSVDVSVTFINVPREKIAFLTFRDVTDRRREEQQLKRVAQTDSLTGLMNKSVINSRMQAALIRANRNERPLSVMFMDLDNFKQCNDTHGHQTGDKLLQAVGRIVRQNIRETDEGFRYGGDEFAVLLAGTDKEAAVVVAERIRRAFEDEQNFGTSINIGIAELEPGMDGQSLLRKADAAVYKAKGSGKNTIFVL